MAALPLVGFEFEFDPEKVPGGAPAPRVELSGSVVTDEAREVAQGRVEDARARSVGAGRGTGARP